MSNHSLLRIQLNGNSFLYHQIRKMVGAAVAVACGSWTPSYLQSCKPFLVCSRPAFSEPAIQVPLAPSTPLVLDSVAFRADKNVFLNKEALASTVNSGRKRRNTNPNRMYDHILLLDGKENAEVNVMWEREV